MSVLCVKMGNYKTKKDFGLTRPGLKPMIYHTRGEYANHYANDVV